MKEILEKVCRAEDLDREEATRIFGALVEGELDPVVIASLLTALKTKGETPDEIAGAADALLAAARPFPKVSGIYVDTCGTGGDGAGTVNISTAVALLLAELGVKVAKHGNRSVSSKCGSADVLERLGVRLESSPETAARSLDDANICFLFAPAYHAGVRHAMPVRRALEMRTIFNLLGPLVNPARPTHQLLGVYDPALCRPMAETLRNLGVERAMVVHGSGLDEIAAHGPTTLAELAGGEVEVRTLTPADFGVATIDLGELAGAGPEGNALWLRETLAGRATDAQRSAIAVNAGAVLYLVGAAENLTEGANRALETLASGRTTHRLNRFVEMSHGTV